MLRKIIYVGLFTGVAAAVPVLVENNPDLLRRTAAVEPAAIDATEPQINVVEPAPAGRRVRMEQDETGHFIGEFRLNGRRINAIVDTGATLVAINRSTARNLGLLIAPGDFKYDVRTANGKTKAATAVIERIQIGRIEVANVQAMVLDDKALVHTLIGMSFLKALDRFQIADGTLLLEQ
ncbi:MAG: TIGR02281 family clan AA aspartic protease [Rhizobiaceae bacterium]